MENVHRVHPLVKKKRKEKKESFKYNVIPTNLVGLARQGNTQYAFTLPTVVISTYEYNTLSTIEEVFKKSSYHQPLSIHKTRT